MDIGLPQSGKISDLDFVAIASLANFANAISSVKIPSTAATSYLPIVFDLKIKNRRTCSELTFLEHKSYRRAIKFELRI